METCAAQWGMCSFAQLSSDLLPCRALERIPPGTKTLFVCLFPYSCGDEAYEKSNLSRFAAVCDYHKVLLARLESACEKLREVCPGEAFAPFADNSPFPEVKAAVYAGLGTIGANGLLHNPQFGSYVFIGEIATTLAMPDSVTEPDEHINADAGCVNCRRCRAVCPGGALRPEGFIREKCLSHITQKKGELSQDEERLLAQSGSAWGCDLCQTVCPKNRGAAVRPLPEFAQSIQPLALPGGNHANRAWAYRGTAVIERNLRLIQKRKGLHIENEPKSSADS